MIGSALESRRPSAARPSMRIAPVIMTAAEALARAFDQGGDRAKREALLSSAADMHEPEIGPQFRRGVERQRQRGRCPGCLGTSSNSTADTARSSGRPVAARGTRRGAGDDPRALPTLLSSRVW